MLHGTPKQKVLGDDGGCFAAALAAVNRCGGVLEHPEATHAFKAHGLAKPPRNGGWIRSGLGWVCCVEQGHYGHRARKATWLYYVGVRQPKDLVWGPSSGKHRIDNCRERKRGEARSKLHGAELRATPIEFRNVLLDLAYLSRCYPSV